MNRQLFFRYSYTYFMHANYGSMLCLFSLQINLYTSMNISLSVEHPRKRVLIGTNIHADILFFKTLLKCLLIVLTCCWISIFLLRSGDIHPNPGPTMSDPSFNTDASSSSFLNSSSTNHISFVHYNIQSLMHKIDVLYTGLREFDLIGITET